MDWKLIKVGKTYEDMNGNRREVIAEGPQFATQFVKDCIRIRVVKVVKEQGGIMKLGEERNIPRLSFANWARKEVNTKAPAASE